MKSIREIAEEIAAPTIGKVAPAVYQEIVADIQKALRDERERALGDAASSVRASKATTRRQSKQRYPSKWMQGTTSTATIRRTG